MIGNIILEKRLISSINKTGIAFPAFLYILALSITSLTSFTPEFMALNEKNGLSWVCEIIKDSVVFPTPGGPQKIMLGMFPLSIALRSTAPSPTKCFWPVYSSSVFGRILSANGS